MAARRVTAPLTEEGQRRYAESRARIDQIRVQVEADLPDLVAAARRAKSAHDAAQGASRVAVTLLKAEREAQGIELSELESRTGIPAVDLGRLEEGEVALGNLAVLERYAAALGKRLHVTLSGST